MAVSPTYNSEYCNTTDPNYAQTNKVVIEPQLLKEKEIQKQKTELISFLESIGIGPELIHVIVEEEKVFLGLMVMQPNTIQINSLDELRKLSDEDLERIVNQRGFKTVLRKKILCSVILISLIY